ncbi:CDP-diacylglycerol--inositol 3-phosphatidyltransferase [Nosema granulosis]|uniref:CDP-diacylglycerol--inositol 3-phosphatidyltransferase n=1 Tax=Nosema granulosis TaxID=83296 RepID=A0A9P6L082_9MICR|nr:CDP-diacylglycerol--inositol 3-phosphatidyltransferase [Nosema granulosis]
MDLFLIFNVPNIIDYARVILLVYAVFLPDRLFLVAYGVSSSLDFFDGHAARFFNQCSMLGACLDMIIDRVSTVVIGMRIIKKEETMYQAISIYILIDLISHFIHFSMSTGSHKKCSNIFLKIYYSKIVLFPICLLSEAFFMSVLYFKNLNGIVYALGGVCVLKTFFHIVQLFTAISRMSMIRNVKKE